MKPFLALVLILSLTAVAGSGPATRIAGAPMLAAQLSAAVGAGFTGGAICGMALAAAIAGGVAIVGAATAGTSLPLAICFRFTLAAEIDVVCALL